VLVVDSHRVEEADNDEHHVIERKELEAPVVRDYSGIRQHNQQILMPHTEAGASHVSSITLHLHAST
jgi:hypothetical protein